MKAIVVSVMLLMSACGPSPAEEAALGARARAAAAWDVWESAEQTKVPELWNAAWTAWRAAALEELGAWEALGEDEDSAARARAVIVALERYDAAGTDMRAVWALQDRAAAGDTSLDARESAAWAHLSESTAALRAAVKAARSAGGE